MDLTEEEIHDAHRFVIEQLDRPVKYETFETRIRPTHERLIEAADAGETITYGELADYASTDRRRYMSNLLYGIGYIEEERGNPPTTVLVVQAGDGQPAKGFIETLDALSIRHRYDASRKQ